MPFSSTFSSFNRPSASDRLNNPSHSALHNTVSSAVGQIEAIIGLDGASSVLGTIIGDLRSPASGGGGHVQTANKGGTGQTTFTKGDLLVATSTSVLSKFAVSSTRGEVLMVDSNEAAGIKWAASPGATKVAINTSSVVIAGGFSSVETAIFSASILGSTLGTNKAIKFTGAIRRFDAQDNANFRIRYGNNIVASINTIPINGSTSVVAGTIEGVVAANGSIGQQLGYYKLSLETNRLGSQALSYARAFSYGNSSVNSDANQDLIISVEYSAGNQANSILSGLFIVEKIV